MLHPDAETSHVTASPEDPLVSARYLAAPPKARAQLEQSRNSRKKGDCKSAIQHAKKATEIAPDFALAYVETGMCEIALDKLDDAQQSFSTAIQRDPKFLYGYIGLAHVQSKREKWNDAAKALGEANHVQPDRAEPFYELAQIQLQTGHLDKAELAAKTAMTKDHTRIPDLPFLLARVFVLENKIDEAATTLKQIVESNPSNEIGARARRSLEAITKAASENKPPK
jgi:cytochrome c-type biogenesis protein CcmH/NrfG